MESYQHAGERFHPLRAEPEDVVGAYERQVAQHDAGVEARVGSGNGVLGADPLVLSGRQQLAGCCPVSDEGQQAGCGCPGQDAGEPLRTLRGNVEPWPSIVSAVGCLGGDAGEFVELLDRSIQR
jgi:hypothetical protein